MNKKIILSLSIMLIFVLNSAAQTFDLKFNVVNSNETNFDVQIQIKSGSTFKLAASNITFDYNTSAISNPSLLSVQNYNDANGSYIYGEMTVTQPDNGIASINIIYTYPSDIHASDVPTIWTDVAILRFNVLNAANLPNLVFRTSGLSPTLIYKIEGNTTTLLSPGNLVTYNEPMPVELTSFIVSVINNSAILKWKTATEVNNYGFDVERTPLSPPFAKGGKQGGWEKIGFVKGNVNSNSVKDYVFDDRNLEPGSYQYRLKQIDNDGKYEYSKEVVIAINDLPSGYALNQNFPNPFNPVTIIKFTIPNTSKVNLSVYNTLGELVVVLEDNYLEAGSYTKEFNASGLASGVYIYRLASESQVLTKIMNLIK